MLSGAPWAVRPLRPVWRYANNLQANGLLRRLSQLIRTNDNISSI